MKRFLLLSLSLVFAFAASAQLAQNVRGTVLDLQSSSPMPGVTVLVIGSEPQIGGITDFDGNFKLENVPVGRVSLQFTYIGYAPVVLNNLELNSAKELILEVEIEEQVSKINEVTVTATNKNEAINEYAVVSARTLSVEDATRYSGTRNDPSRMAQNFAGVSGVSDDRNDIIIRGNSPSGVLWRMEGIDIPSPQHFSTLGATGGPVSMLNTNNLKDSDFITGAFPAQYGNALAGAFDLKLRNGNNENYEFLGQIGFNGFELGAEGPFSKNSKASFVANYRYSTLGVLSALGVNFGTGAAIPQYQDAVFKINVPTKKAGKFVLFGMGGLSYIEFLDSEKEDTDFFSEDGFDSRFRSNTGVIGFSHTYFLSDKAYTKVTLAVSGTQSTSEVDSLEAENSNPIRTYEATYNQVKYSAGYEFNKKFNAKNKITAGALYDIFDLKLNDAALVDVGDFRKLTDFDGLTSLLQVYANWQHRFSDAWTTNLGLHGQQAFLNNSWIVEPRANVQYKFQKNQSLSLGMGLHSQTQPMEVLFYETRLTDGSFVTTNKELDFTKSAQVVMAYDNLLTDKLRIKVEGYYQYLYDVPVETAPTNFSLLNAGADFGFPKVDSLLNEGSGYNYGLELTFEKFLSKGYYFLFTTSLFNSKYDGSDGVTRNTAFNGNYVFNLLGGKEFRFRDKNAILIDAKITIAGGKRYTPIDLVASQAAGVEVLKEDEAFEAQYKTYIRPDIKLTYSREGKKVTQQFSVDLQNVINYQNIFSQDYNAKTGEIETTYQLGLFPDVQYRILF